MYYRAAMRDEQGGDQQDTTCQLNALAGGNSASHHV